MTEESLQIDNKKILKRSESFILGFCRCGCSNEIPLRNTKGLLQRFEIQHQNRGNCHPSWNPILHPELLKVVDFTYCKCGCKKTRPRFDKYGVEREYISGHQTINSLTYITKQGYRKKKCHGHPRADRCNYVPEHILVMEKHIGRYITKEEEIHHKNIGNLSLWENRHDNRIENLELFSNHKDHMRTHTIENSDDPDQRICNICGKSETLWDKKHKYYHWMRDPVTKDVWLCHKCYCKKWYYVKKGITPQ